MGNFKLEHPEPEGDFRDSIWYLKYTQTHKFAELRHNCLLKYNCLDFRNKWNRDVSWAIPSPDSIDAISDFTNNILEVGCGHALWASLLQHNNIQVEACDIIEEERNSYINDNLKPFMNVNFMFEDDIRERVKCVDYETLMFIWPPWHEWSTNYLKSSMPKKVVYVGEGYGGCCAPESFFELLEENYNIEYENIPQWYGINDYVCLCERK